MMTRQFLQFSEQFDLDARMRSRTGPREVTIVQEREIKVPKIEYRERIVEVPQVLPRLLAPDCS